MIRSDSFVKFDFAIMDSLSYSRVLSDNPVSAFKEIMTIKPEREQPV